MANVFQAKLDEMRALVADNLDKSFTIVLTGAEMAAVGAIVGLAIDARAEYGAEPLSSLDSAFAKLKDQHFGQMRTEWPEEIP